jgi:hypothetical protein
VIFLKILQLIKCELPPPPSSFYSRPNARPFMPTIPPSDSYGPPPPANPSNSYGLPAEYGPPSPIENETPAPIIHKHVYIHIPPPEPEYVEIPNDPVQPVQKHYRIIFIKAPTVAAPTAQAVQQAVTEEKTIVYVLVKKPDNVREVLPAPATTLPSKPEVYFIRYKTEEKTTLTPEIESGGYYKKR